MQPACGLRLAPTRPQPPEVARARAGTATRRHGCAWCVAPARRRLRARAPCGGGATEPVEARKDDGPAPEAEEAAGLAPEELEVLEEAAITGDDEGRRPTDYDRRARIFEESSRVFRELKQRSDGGGGGSESGPGAGRATAGATAAETTVCNEQRQRSSSSSSN